MQVSSFQDPNVYAQQYATQNNLSLDDAKSQLKAKYGDPAQPKGLSFSNTLTSDTFTPSTNSFSNINLSDLLNEDEDTSTKSTSIIDFIKGLIENLRTGKNNGDSENNTTEVSNQKGNPDEIAKMYAELKNISVDEAKTELKNMFGEPQQQ